MSERFFVAYQEMKRLSTPHIKRQEIKNSNHIKIIVKVVMSSKTS